MWWFIGIVVHVVGPVVLLQGVHYFLVVVQFEGEIVEFRNFFFLLIYVVLMGFFVVLVQVEEVGFVLLIDWMQLKDGWLVEKDFWLWCGRFFIDQVDLYVSQGEVKWEYRYGVGIKLDFLWYCFQMFEGLSIEVVEIIEHIFIWVGGIKDVLVGKVDGWVELDKCLRGILEQ